MNDFNRRVQRYVNVYNYTFDQNALKNAINFMYSPWADPSNKTLIRQGLIDVSCHVLACLVVLNLCLLIDDH